MNPPHESSRCRFPLNDLESFLSRDALLAGRRLFEAGQVVELSLQTERQWDGRRTICIGQSKGQIRGETTRQSYTAQFFWESDPAAYTLSDINGWCTCEQGHGCEHVAALAYAVHHQLHSAHTETDWRTQLAHLHQTLQNTRIPRDRTPFIAWLVQERAACQVLIPLQTQRSKQNPGRLLKGERIRGRCWLEAATSLDEALLKHLDPFTHEVPLHLFSPTLIRLLLQSGRVWLIDDYQQVDHALQWRDEPIPLTLKWQRTNRDLWHLSTTLPEHCTLWKSPQPWLLFDRARRSVHPVDLPLPCWQIETLMEQYWHLPDETAVDRFSTQWRSLFGAHFPIAPPWQQERHIEHIRPRALLTPERLSGRAATYALVLSGWRYGDVTLAPSDPRSLISDGDRLLQRDPEAEADILAAFDRFIRHHRLPLRRAQTTERPTWHHHGDAFVPYASLFLFHDLHRMQAEALADIDVEILWPETLPHIRTARRFSSHLTPDPANPALLEMEVTLEADGQRLSLTRVLSELITHLPPGATLPPAICLEAQDEAGTRLYRIPTKAVRPWLDALYSLHARGALKPDATPRLHRLEALQLPPEAVQTDDDTIRRLLHHALQPPAAGEIMPPADFAATLRPYQQQGVAWLQQLRNWGLNGVLADDMGLGKTIQTLAHLCIERDAGRLETPALIIAPTSVASNWRDEAARFAPTLRTCLLTGPDRQRHFPNLTDYDLIITTYSLLPRDFDTLKQVSWSWVILDEAHLIKNPRAKISRLARQLPGRHRLCLTGTPVENHLGELWALFDFLMPGLLGSQTHFQRFWRTPIEKHGNTALQAALRRRLSPLMLRRTKRQVVEELPPKNEILLRIPLAPAQRRLYETVQATLAQEVRQALAKQGLAGSQVTVLNALTRLRQICCHPQLLPELKDKPHEATKLDALVEMVTELVSAGRRLLIFSQFATMLGMIEARLKQADIATAMLTGQTRDRSTVIRRFKRGEVPVFLISLKAGGVGLNLTEADTVILYDPWWNPAAENQAIDRAHRIGQQETVFVYRLIAEGTIEERILHMQERKHQLAQSVHTETDPDRPPFRLTEEDILALFELTSPPSA